MDLRLLGHLNSFMLRDLSMIVEQYTPFAGALSQSIPAPASVVSLAVLPDGRLASGSFDKTIRIWDLVTGSSEILEGHISPVKALAVLPDGRLASGPVDRTILIWE